MANAAQNIADTTTPTLDRVRALIALLFGMLGDPTRLSDFHRICEEAEALLARCLFETAARFAGRTDLLDNCEAYFVSKGHSFDIRIRLKPEALHPYHRIILEKWRAIRTAKYRRALGRRARFTKKLSYLHFRNQRRCHAPIIARTTACGASPSHTPVRVSAPP